ncbi:hypothetical protein [Herbiconiux liukaitaii]|uniref:hypothetical protein n=1 Tax=Herbiconiux liukaitaii TaxID=3342799 RepID=UPI0035B8FD39
MDAGNSRAGVVMRPRVQIIRQVRLAAAALILPVFTAMLWFAIPRGTWLRVVVAFAFVTALYLVGAALLRRVSIRLTDDGVVERGFFRRETRVPAKRIAAAVVLDVYRGVTAETDRQLFLVDSAGELLVRLRGEYWTNEAIETVASTFGVPVRRSPDPVTTAQLRRDVPELLFWFERWPWAGRLTIVGIIALLALILIALLSPEILVLGAPSSEQSAARG